MVNSTTMFQFPESTFIIAEIGINHNGSLEIAKQLIDVAVDAGCDAVKFQKRTPHMSLPPHLWDVERDTPWGERMTYIKYRQRIELSSNDYLAIDEHCKRRGIIWFASPWDCNAADTLSCMGIPLFKLASASITNLPLVEHVAKIGRPVIMSTGMSTYGDIFEATKILHRHVPQLALLVCTSTYPAKVTDLHLNRITALQEAFPGFVIGYSGHEPGLWTTLCAVAMGARIIERHITLDRTMPGSDQAASVEPQGFKKLVHEIRQFEKAKGSGEIRVLECEHKDIERLRGVQNPHTGASCVL